MKSINLLLTLVLSIFCYTTHAQIKVFSGGINSYGTTTQPSGNTRHLINGNIRFDAWTDVILDWNSGYCCGTPTLYPENPWYLQLGTHNNYVGTGHFGHVSTRLYTLVPSDSTLKQNINYNLTVFDSLLQLKPASYYYKPNILPGAPDSVLQKVCSVKEYGLIAQDVLSVFPELVEMEDSTGIYSIKYTAFIPILIDAIKNQQSQIEDQQTLINNLVSQISSIESQILSLSAQLNSCCPGESSQKSENSNNDDNIEQQSKLTNVSELNNAKNSQTNLKQNRPNPFNQQTTIDYYVAEQNAQAQILIFDLNGRLIKTNKLNHNKGSLIINARELAAGMYYYTLVVNNKEIDTKKMIITE